MNRLLLILPMILVLVCSSAQARDFSDTSADAKNEISAGSPFSQSKLIPDISLTLDFSCLYRNVSDKKYDTLKSPEFTLASTDEAAHGHDIEEMNANRGFNLNYAEITFYSVVDPYFDLFAVCHIGTDHAELEEGYFTTRGLPLGLQLKAGKFLSSFGRINEQHAHNWDFSDNSLVYKFFFGEEGLNEIGVRLTCVVPLDFYLMFGAEILQGENEMSFGNKGFRSINGAVDRSGSQGPDLYTGYMKTSFDIGDLIVFTGISGAAGKTQNNHGLDYVAGTTTGNAVSADSYIVAGDITLRYSIDSIRYVSLQTEYLYRRQDGTLYNRDVLNNVTISDLRKKQSGLYAQFVAKLSKRWRLGCRYDLLQKNEVKHNGMNAREPENLPRYAGMLEYNPTEFSRIRLQYNHDLSKYEYETGTPGRKLNQEVIFQYNLAIGAHGAHAF